MMGSLFSSTVLLVALFEEEEDARVAHDAGADGAFVEAAELLDDADNPAVVLAIALGNPG